MNITIDGQVWEFTTGQSILDVALQNDLKIPHLCYEHHIGSPDGCGLCLVRIEGRPKAVRACDTAAEDGMVIDTNAPEIIHLRETALQEIINHHRGDCRPPCRNACPANNDCQGYIGLIANGRYAEAVRLIKEDNPLPASIGRICPHPCEDVCRRMAKKINCWPHGECFTNCDEHCHRDLAKQALNIAKLKQFAGDWDLAQPQPYRPPQAAASGKKVAIVGAGPSGLSTAYFLLRAGHEAEIFEAMPKAGGMLRYGIPEYRLPKNVLDKEIGLIEDMGLVIHYNQQLGKDFTIASLREKYDAVFLGVGAWSSIQTGIEGEDMPGFCGGIEFLIDAANHKVSCEGETVAVIGGGSSAIDAARTALRLGAKQVELVCILPLPSVKWEMLKAQEEGVIMHPLVTPISAIVENGKVAGLLMQKVELGEPDANGCPLPIPIEGLTEDRPYDRIISAIGQKVVLNGLEGLELTSEKTIQADEGTFATNLEGVFAGGDATNQGPDIAIRAIADGKNAAKVIDNYLAGEIKPVVKHILMENPNYTRPEMAPFKLANKISLTFLPAEERKQNFDEIILPYTEREAQREASRCLECGCHDYYDCQLLPLIQEYNLQGEKTTDDVRIYERQYPQPTIWLNINKCILCGACVKVCRKVTPKEVPALWNRVSDPAAAMPFVIPLKDSDCNACGTCVSSCPTGAITLRWPLGKTPPLPTEKVEMICPYCKEACKLIVSYYGNWLVEVKPAQEKICALARWGMALDINGIDVRNNPVQPAEEKILAMIYKNLDLYPGELPPTSTLEEFVALLRQLKK